VSFSPQASGADSSYIEVYITENVNSFFAHVNGVGTAENAPNPPSITSVAGGNQQITVAFVAGAGPQAASYTVTCTSSNGGAAGNATATANPIVVTGLTNGKSYTCTVTASNGGGSSAASSASSTVTPTNANPQPNPIPTLSEWEKTMMMLMLLASVAWSWQRAMGR
jgi:hypothetical protein